MKVIPAPGTSTKQRRVAWTAGGLLAVVALAALPMPAFAARGRVHTYRLPGHGTLTVPSSSITEGTTIVVGKAPSKRLPRGTVSIGRSVALAVKGGRLVGPVRLTFPYPKRINAFGLPIDLTVQIAYYDIKTRTWKTVPGHVDQRSHTVSATITHFSWWNPLSWDWGSLSLRLDQRIGELRGARTGPAHCDSGVSVPTWANVVVDNSADLRLRTCAEGKDGMVVVQIVNNRPFGVILKYGTAVNFGWHETPSEAAGALGVAFAEHLVSPNELYIAPLQAASVGVASGNWSYAQFQAFVTPKSLAADALTLAANGVDAKVRPAFFTTLGAQCSEILKPGVDGAPVLATNQVEYMTGISSCILAALPAAAKAGALDGAKLDQLEHGVAFLSRLNIAGETAQVAGYLADLYVSTKVSGLQGPSFSIGKRSSDQPATSITPSTPSTPSTPTTPTTPATPTTPTSPTTPTTPTTPGTPAAPVTWREQVWSPSGVGTFQNYNNAGGPGARLATNQFVQVSCKVYDTTIASASPGGYWYRIADSPFNNAYYSPANSFWNGDIPGQLPYTHSFDAAVPNC